MSTVHICVMVLTVLAVTSRTNSQTVYSGVISLVIGILFVLKMIYQIKYIPQALYDAHCNETDTGNSTSGNSTSNSTFVVNNPNNNTANWLGFNKLLEGQTLMQLLSEYIVYIVALTAYNMILLHQQRKRYI